jgi:hypothetical protein
MHARRTECVAGSRSLSKEGTGPGPVRPWDQVERPWGTVSVPGSAGPLGHDSAQRECVPRAGRWVGGEAVRVRGIMYIANLLFPTVTPRRQAWNCSTDGLPLQPAVWRPSTTSLQWWESIPHEEILHWDGMHSWLLLRLCVSMPCIMHEFHESCTCMLCMHDSAEQWL